MNSLIDTKFDVYSDTPLGKDPDSFSPTLRGYHKLLWSKPLPNGIMFSLSDKQPRAYLYHKSTSLEVFLSSDSISHTYRYVKAMASIIEKVPESEMIQNFHVCSTIGAFVIFPSKTINRKPTINGARGLNRKIWDRFDLTLECIRRHYNSEESPLSEVLARYADFFNLFRSFEEYVEFFLFQDLVEQDGKTIRTFLPFSNFDASPLPTDLEEYRSYMSGVTSFIRRRNTRISNFSQ